MYRNPTKLHVMLFLNFCKGFGLVCDSNGLDINVCQLKSPSLISEEEKCLAFTLHARGSFKTVLTTVAENGKVLGDSRKEHSFKTQWDAQEHSVTLPAGNVTVILIANTFNDKTRRIELSKIKMSNTPCKLGRC